LHSECGRWYRDQDLSGFDLPGTGSEVESDALCLKMCQDTKGCNAIVHKKFTSQECWLKEYPEEMPWSPLVGNPESNSMWLCRNQTLAGIEEQRDQVLAFKLKLAALVLVGVVVALMIAAVVAAIWVRRQKVFTQRAAAGGPYASSEKANSTAPRRSLMAFSQACTAKHKVGTSRGDSTPVRLQHSL
jgi:hypothetical protein